MRRIGLVVNPAAGAGRGAQVADAVRHAVRGLSARVEDLSAGNGLDAVARAHRQVHAGAVDALVVVGGDGMAHLGVNAVAGTQVPLGLVPVGSGNDLARSVGLPVNRHEESLRLIHAALDPTDPSAGARPLDAIRLRRPPAAGRLPRLDLVPDGPDERWAASSVIVGLAAAVNDRANGYHRPRGSAKYLRAVVAETLRFSPYGMATVTDGEPWEGPATLLALANTALFGGGLPVAPDAVPDDGMLDAVHIDAVSRATISTLFPRFARGSHTTLRQVRITRARRVTVAQAPAHGRELPVAMADGEGVGRLPLLAEVVPAAWHLLAPVGADRDAASAAAT